MLNESRSVSSHRVILFAVNEWHGGRTHTDALAASRQEADSIAHFYSKGRAVNAATPQVSHVAGQFEPGEFYRLMQVSPKAGFLPEHPLAIPAELDAHTETFYAPDEFLSRADALRQTAAHNRRVMEGTEQDTAWAVVVQVGKPMQCRALVTQRVEGAAGYEESVVYRPIRVVQPTAAEVDCCIQRCLVSNLRRVVIRAAAEVDRCCQREPAMV